MTAAAPGSETREVVTVLFCDVVGFTAAGERVDHEELRRLQSRYFEAAQEVLERHGATVEKFIGDAVMAVFGLPTRRTLGSDPTALRARARVLARRGELDAAEWLAREALALDGNAPSPHGRAAILLTLPTPTAASTHVSSSATRSSGSGSRCRRSRALLEEVEEDLLAFYCFPRDHWPKLRPTNPLERVNSEIGRCTDVVGIFPNDRALIGLAASEVIEQNDEWLVGRRYLSAHSLEAVTDQEKADKDREEARELTAA